MFSQAVFSELQWLSLPQLVQSPLVGISCSQPHILQKAASGIYCPLCQEQTLVSLELGFNLLMYLRDCIGRGVCGCQTYFNLSVSQTLYFQSNLNQPSLTQPAESQFTLISNGRCITSLITAFLWFFSSSFIATIFFLTGIRTALVLKTWTKLGYIERHNNSSYSLLFS